MRRDSCLICQIVEGKIPSFKIAEHAKAIAVLDINGANPGHAFIIPKSHSPILEQVPDEDIGALFDLANKVSVALFDLLGAEGTNIFVANGIPAGQTVAHFMINVIPRKQGDSINFQWKPRQLSEEEISTVELKIKEELKGTAIEKKTPSPRKAASPRPRTPASRPVELEDAEALHQLTRIP
jgi:histidine triad (HIT) family protein